MSIFGPQIESSWVELWRRFTVMLWDFVSETELISAREGSLESIATRAWPIISTLFFKKNRRRQKFREAVQFEGYGDSQLVTDERSSTIKKEFCMLRTLFRMPATFLIFACLCNCLSAADTSEQSVEKLRAILSSIDPYLPKEQVAGKLEVFGSGSMDGLMNAWAENFRDFHAQATVEVSGMPEADSMKKLIASPASIWMVSRPIAPEELKALKAKGLKNPVALEVAREALGVFVHPSNPVTSITSEQLRAVFIGKDPAIWKMLGASGAMADKPIKLIRRSDTSGTQKFLQDVLFSTKMRDGEAVESNSAVVNKIKDEPLGIGICGLRCGSRVARPLSLKAGENIVPSDDMAVLSGRYPLVRPMSIVIDLGSANKNTLEFVHYMLSQSGQTETVLAGLFPIDLPLMRAELQTIDAPQQR
jgi:phosphate transport system substrate-binding protein